jgi:hypothetical protein
VAATGEQGHVTAFIRQATPLPPQRYDNAWTLGFENGQGAALLDVEVTAIQSYMPVHGHDGRPPATVEKTGQAGEVLASLNFSMRGYWEVRIHASSPTAGDDDLVFKLCLRE